MKYGYVRLQAINREVAIENVRQIYSQHHWHIQKTIDFTKYPAGELHSIKFNKDHFSNLQTH